MMKEGAFAFLDCLGWKGIWKRTENHDPTPLLSKLHLIKNVILEQLEKKEGIFDFLHVIPAESPSIGFLSDTVFISLIPKKNHGEKLETWEKGAFISMMSTLAGEVIDMYIRDAPFLTIRGCISYDAHTCDENFIIGPAIDDAASEEKLVKGAYVWLHPNCEPLYEAFLERYQRNAIEKRYFKIHREDDLNDKERLEKEKEIARYHFSSIFFEDQYELPLAENKKALRIVLNPLLKYTELEKRKEIIDNYLGTMTEESRPIIEKRENTLAMLELAEKSTEKFYSRYRKEYSIRQN